MLDLPHKQLGVPACRLAKIEHHQPPTPLAQRVQIAGHLAQRLSLRLRVPAQLHFDRMTLPLPRHQQIQRPTCWVSPEGPGMTSPVRLQRGAFQRFRRRLQVWTWKSRVWRFEAQVRRSRSQVRTSDFRVWRSGLQRKRPPRPAIVAKKPANVMARPSFEMARAANVMARPAFELARAAILRT